MKALEVLPGWVIPAQDLEVSFARSSGPGGQNVNKLSTKVELRLKLAQTPALTPTQKRRLAAKYPAHTTTSGDFVISSDRYRSQKRNQADARARLSEMLLSIRRPPPPRVATKPTRAAKARRLGDKRRRSEVKQQRRKTDDC